MIDLIIVTFFTIAISGIAFTWGWYYGTRTAAAPITREEIRKMADEEVVRALQISSSIWVLLGNYIYKQVQEQCVYPHNDVAVLSLIQRKVGLN